MNKTSQTRYSFAEKWSASAEFQTGGEKGFDSDTLGWIVSRNGFSSLADFGTHLSRFRTILDAGCGNGRILGLIADVVNSETSLIGLDFAAAEIARKNLGNRVKEIFAVDLMDASSLSVIPRPDFIYCQEVLHHTSNPERSFLNLVDILLPGGEIAIYVYKKKSPVREFTDDFVRERIKSLDSTEAMRQASQFAQLGKVLSELDVEFDVAAVEALEIPAGRYTIQRFLYNFFAKCYWNPELSVEHNNMINFDWYHPSLCSRHTLVEVHGWFKSADLTVIHSHVDEYGITMRGVKA